MKLNRRRYLATVGATASTLSLAGCSGNSDNSDDETNGDHYVEGRELTWDGDCPPTDVQVAKDMAAALSRAGYTVENEATISRRQHGDQTASRASATYSVREDVPVVISIDVWDSHEIASNVTREEVDSRAISWRGESVTLSMGALAHFWDSSSSVTAEFHTLTEEYQDELWEFYLTAPCFDAKQVVDTSLN